MSLTSFNHSEVSENQKQQSIIHLITELSEIRTKRNTALTIIEASDISKTLIGIKRQILCIKHKTKKVQLLNLFQELDINVKKHLNANNKNTGIFCIGHKIDNDIYYKYIDVDPKISSYDYDDVFNVFKISILMFNLQTITPHELKELIGRTDDKMNDNIHNKMSEFTDDYKYRYFMDKEIDIYMDVINTIYHVTPSINPIPVPIKWLASGKQIKLIIDPIFDKSCPFSVCGSIGI